MEGRLGLQPELWMDSEQFQSTVAIWDSTYMQDKVQIYSSVVVYRECPYKGFRIQMQQVLNEQGAFSSLKVSFTSSDTGQLSPLSIAKSVSGE